MSIGVRLSAAAAFFVLFVSLPLFTHALGSAADAMCNPVIQQCGCGQVMGPKGCTAGANKFMCPCFDSTNDFTTAGVCVSMNKCQAKSTSDSKGPDAGLGQLGQILGQVLGKLMQPSQQPTDPNTGLPTTATGCTTGYFQTSDITQLSNPCAQYTPGNTCPVGQIQSCTTTTSCTCVPSNSCDTLSRLLGLCGSPTPTTTATTTPVSCPDTGITCQAGFIVQSVSGLDSNGCHIKSQCVLASGGSTTTPAVASGSLTATPTSGRVPLAVTFLTASLQTGTYSVDVGDGSGSVALSESTCSDTLGTCRYTSPYTYLSTGTFVAKLQNQLGQNLAVATVTVTASLTTSSNTNHTNTTGQGTLGGGIGVNLGTSTGGTAGDTGNPFNLGSVATLPAGDTLGDLTGGAPSLPDSLTVLTRLAGGLSAGNASGTIADALGATTTYFGGGPGVQAQPGMLAGVCHSRPWASPPLSSFLPASVFDSVCGWLGYGASIQQLPSTVTLQQTPNQTPPHTPPQSTTTPQTTPGTVHIWAVPASVPLNARTTVQWTTQGVTNCLETSPDGSFEEHSLSGAAHTVPLVEPTTFSISCLDTSGNPVTDFTTVQIGL